MATVLPTPADAVLLDILNENEKQVLAHTGPATQVAEVSGVLSTSTTPAVSKPEFDPKVHVLDTEGLKAKYKKEREKRLAANAAGFDQYQLVDSKHPFFSKYLADPYIQELIVRGPLSEEADVFIIGGGYGGLLAAARLIEHGVKDIKLVEKGGDFGGTW
jgi:NADPH-dependent 2,4-dienoyl-CoA reductase/sulfur reductase-like enzyme